MTDTLALVQEFGTVITSSLVLEETLALIAQRTGEALDVFECNLYEYSADSGTLVCTGFWSREPSNDDLAWVGTVVDVSKRPDLQCVVNDKVMLEDRLSDPALDPAARSLMEQWHEKAALTVPLVFRDELIGCLVLIEKRTDRSFTDAERETLGALAVPAAIAIHNARMFRRQEDRNRHLASLLDASRAITSSVVLEDVLTLVAENAARTLDSPECIIYEYDRLADAIIFRSFFAQPGHERGDGDDQIGVPFGLNEYPSGRKLLREGIAVEEHISDPRLPDDVRRFMEERSDKSRLNTPLVFDGEPLGLLVLNEMDRERRFMSEELELVQGLGEQAAVAIHNARLFRRRGEQNQRLVTLLDVSQAITGSLDAAEVVARVTREVGTMFGSADTQAEVWLRVDASLYLPFQSGLADGGVTDVAATPPDTLARHAIDRLGPSQTAGGSGDQRLVVPLVLNRQAEGYLDLSCHRSGPFSDDEVQLVQILVNQAAVALENADNYGRLETMYLETVTALAAAMEAKDHYTAEHADMLAAMAVSVGRRLGLSETELRELQYAAVLHDIGKIGIPGSILNKPDRLTADEFKTMAQHTIIGERIISRIEYLEPIAKIIRAAHERWDGLGYPDKISGESIPLAARILLVCDAYHAMTSDRPYRAALPEETALHELEQNAGTQFDPRVVEIFIEVWPDFETSDAEPHLAYMVPVWKDRRARRDMRVRSA